MKSFPELDPLPITLANPINMNPLFCFDNRAVSVNYYIYDKKKKTIVKFGSSRACGINHRSSSIHAEEIAINNVDIEALGLYTLGELRKSSDKQDIENYQQAFKK